VLLTCSYVKSLHSGLSRRALEVVQCHIVLATGYQHISNTLATLVTFRTALDVVQCDQSARLGFRV
jgi:hypothetical protein